MGDQCPSPAPPCPQTPGPGLAAFRTSPSLDWVSPVAPAENTVRAMQYLFFSSDFPLSYHSTALSDSIYYQDHPTVTWQCAYPVSAHSLPHSYSTPTIQPMYRTRVLNCLVISDSSTVPINRSTILYWQSTRSVFSTNSSFPVHGCPSMSVWQFPPDHRCPFLMVHYTAVIHHGEACGHNRGTFSQSNDGPSTIPIQWAPTQVHHNAVRGHHTALQRTKTQKYALTRLERATCPSQPFLVSTAYKTPLHTIMWIQQHSIHLEDQTSPMPSILHDRISSGLYNICYPWFSSHCDFCQISMFFLMRLCT